MKDRHSGYVNSRVLKFQVGFLLADGGGHSRDSELDIPTLRVADDMYLDYLRGNLRFSRTSRGILVQGTLHTSVLAECNRCLTETSVDLTLPLEEVFVYPPEPDADFTVADDGILDVAPLVRQEVILATPLGVLCRPNCAGLCPTCGRNLNDGPCDCDRDAIDPRLAALKQLKSRLSEE